MKRVLLARVVCVVATCLAVTGIAQAQPAMDLNVLNNGKPVPNASVTAMLNGVKQTVGTTGSDGQIAIDTSLLNIGKGTEVTVWVKTCEDGKVEVILVPAGEEGECTQEGAQEGERCGCRKAGVFFWGNGPVTIDVGTGTVSQVTTGAGSAWSGLTFGVGVDVRQMLNLEDVLNLVPGGSDASATGWAPGFQLLAEYRFARMLSLSVEGGYSTMDTEVRFVEGVQKGDLKYYELGGNLKVGLPDNGQRIRPYVMFGLYRTWNKAEFTLGSLSEHSIHKTRLDGVGAGFDYRLRPNLDARIEGFFMSTFKDDDADEHIRWKFGLNYRPFRRPILTY